MMRRRTMRNKKLVLFTKRFYTAGSYIWIVPDGCTKADVCVIGGGGGGARAGGGGGGGGILDGGAGRPGGNGGDGAIIIRYYAYE